jgi:hypothetical protein
MTDALFQNPERPEKWDCSPTILVAGNHAMRQALVERLRLDGYLVLEAPDGDEALRILVAQSRRIHILLTNVSTDGSSLAATLNTYRPEMRALFFEGDPEYVLGKIREILKPPTKGPAAG